MFVLSSQKEVHMKRIVFLLLCLLCSVNNTEASTKTFKVNESNYIITTIYEEEIRGFTLEKQGMSPFTTTYIAKGESYIINGVKELKDMVVVYGSVHIKGADTYYDAVLLFFDNEGNFIKKQIEDYLQLEETIDIVQLKDNYIVIIREDEEIDGVYETKGYHYLLFDSFFTKIKEQSNTHEVRKTKITSEYLLLNYDYDDYYEYALTSNLEIIYHNDPLPIEINQVYSNEAVIPFINTALINDIEYRNGAVISYPGHYEMMYLDSMYYFTVEPLIEGVEDQGIYTDEVIINYHAGNATLNNDVYINQTPITTPGNHTFILSGINGYTKTINFTIVPSIDGLINNHTYHSPFQFHFDGEGILNEEQVSSPVMIQEEGEYTFKVFGENDYFEQYTFRYEEVEESESIVTIIQKYDLVFLITTIIIGVIILKKK